MEKINFEGETSIEKTKNIGGKELDAFKTMLESWIERKLVSEKNANELISKMEGNDIDFFEAWEEMFILLADRFIALDKLKDEPYLLKKRINEQQEEERLKQLQDALDKEKELDVIFGRFSKFYDLAKSKKRERKNSQETGKEQEQEKQASDLQEK